MKAVPENLIRARAHEIWEQSGRPVGLDKLHWEQAAREFSDAAALLAGREIVDGRAGERRSGIDMRSDEDKRLIGERRSALDRRSGKGSKAKRPSKPKAP